MNTKTLLTAVIGAVVGLGLAMGTMVFAQNTDHMGNFKTTQQAAPNQNIHGSMHGKTVYGANTRGLGQGMMGQTTPQKAKPLDTHEQMHGKAVTTQTGGMMGQATPQNTYGGMGGMHQQAPVTTHHASFSQPATNTLCHEETTAKAGEKT